MRNPNYKIKKHSTLAEYRAALGEAQFRRLFKFTCVRNPWDRMISLYFSPSRGRRQWDRKLFKKLLSNTLSVADHLRLEKNDADPFSNVDRVMRFEALATDFRSVCNELAIPWAPLPIYNRSSCEHYSRYFDDELRESVRQQFAPEIERFGYTFDRTE